MSVGDSAGSGEKHPARQSGALGLVIEIKGYEKVKASVDAIIKDYREKVGADISQEAKAQYREAAEKAITKLGFSIGDARRWLLAPNRRR